MHEGVISDSLNKFSAMGLFTYLKHLLLEMFIKGVALFQADWTNEDAEITRALDALGRSGVPVYVLYNGTQDTPVLLPEILTESILLDALAQLPDQALTAS